MNTRTTLALGACLSLVSLGVSAHSSVEGSVEASGGSYITTGGSVLKTGMGNCLQSGTFSSDDAINACEGVADGDGAEATAEAEVAEAPAAEEPTQTSKIDTQEFSEQTLFDTDSAALNIRLAAAEKENATLRDQRDEIAGRLDQAIAKLQQILQAP